MLGAAGKSIKYNGLIGKGIIYLVLAVTALSFIYTPYDPVAIDLDKRLSAPSWQHWLGTDQFGRDIASRMIAAAKVSVLVSLLTVMIALLLGTVFGTIAGYVGGNTDLIMMVFLDALMAIPGILLALAIMVVVGPSVYSLILALGIAYTPNVTRLVRGVVLSIKQHDYIEASKAMGKTNTYTIIRHVIPNCITPLTVTASSLFAFALLAESALSFLGLGVPPPYPTWGGMLSDGRQYIATASWMSIFPGVAISITLLGINLLGDALRDRFDPRMNAL